MQSTIGIQIPVSDTYLTGQPYTFNTAFQYRLGKMLWPELEVNAMGNKGGPSDGKKQTFLTPGIIRRADCVKSKHGTHIWSGDADRRNQVSHL